MAVIGLEEVCKVRNDAVGGRYGKGYRLAVFKKANKNSARIALLDASLVPSKTLLTVQLNTLWKIKVSQRKGLERRVKDALQHKAAPVPPINTEPVETPTIEEVPIFGEIIKKTEHVMGIESSYQIDLDRCNGTLYLAFDSVLHFHGDAIVNAANTGCLGGGGIDGMVNVLGGEELYQARKALPVIDGGSDDAYNAYGMRCATGDAKITIAGKLPCSKIIHAVGPRFGCCEHAAPLIELEMAYKSAMDRARENGLSSVGFCIISAGIFRGTCPLETIVKTALVSIAKYAYIGLKTVVLCGYTPEERRAITELVEPSGSGSLESGLRWTAA